jgi:hypothetical protein
LKGDLCDRTHERCEKRCALGLRQTCWTPPCKNLSNYLRKLIWHQFK